MKKLLSSILLIVMISAAFAAEIHVSAVKTGFSAVGDDRWRASSIGYAVRCGYMNGVGDGKFDPKGSLTRAMVAAVLWRREGSPAPASPSRLCTRLGRIGAHWVWKVKKKKKKETVRLCPGGVGAPVRQTQRCCAFASQVQPFSRPGSSLTALG